MSPVAAPTARTKLLDAALHLVRAQGYAATTVDELCAQAGVTKGAFFHHFKSKDELAVAAARHFSEMAQGLFATAPYHAPEDPLDRLLGYVDFRDQLLGGELAEYTCLLGTLAQETYDSHPHIREAVERELAVHVKGLLPDIAAAKRKYAPKAAWTPESLGYYMAAEGVGIGLPAMLPAVD